VTFGCLSVIIVLPVVWRLRSVDESR
jgi:hypothetical protein